jgi:hypothetical protein
MKEIAELEKISLEDTNEFEFYQKIVKIAKNAG